MSDYNQAINLNPKNTSAYNTNTVRQTWSLAGPSTGRARAWALRSPMSFWTRAWRGLVIPIHGLEQRGTRAKDWRSSPQIEVTSYESSN
jgi:hypothetical protein